MRYHSFLVKYAEIGTKGKNRYIFEDALIRQIKLHLKKVEGEFAVVKEQGRIYVNAKSDYDYDEVIGALKKVFGIVGICPMTQLADEGYEKLRKEIVKFIDEEYPDKHFTFKVRAKRTNKHYPVTSDEINADVGYDILTAFPETKVDVRNPEVMIHIEVRQQINVYSKVIKGAGGMPIGTNGKAMLLLSGGIDSPVAGYMIAKRGVMIEAVYFHAPPYTSERAKQKVVDLAKIVAGYAGPIKLHVINFTEIQLYIYEQCPHDELTIIMRRYMMMIAEMIAKKEGAMALVTGESLGQVASQTLESMYVTNNAVEMPVFRPLVGMDKTDIVDISREIGTYETSILPYEDCCTIFVPKHPKTKPRLDDIKESEKNIDGIEEMLIEAMENSEIINL